MKKLSKQEIEQAVHNHMVFLAGESKKSQIKKYGGKEGYREEMKRRSGLRKKLLDKKA